MQPGFEIIDHTADLGIRVTAGDLPQLLVPAAQGLYAAVGELVGIGELRERGIDWVGPDAATLLRDYLAELLLMFELDHCILNHATVEAFTTQQLKADLHMRQIDPQASVYHREVKAVTYHELAIRAVPGGLEATVILDI